MTILIDIDGVIFNTQETLLKQINEAYKTEYKLDDITSYDWFDRKFNGNPWESLESESFWHYVKADREAIDYIIKWKHEGHIIKFVTASYYHHALPFKIHKLLNYFNGEFDDKDVIICHDKNMINGTILIDDCWDNVNKFANKFGSYGILYRQPWNIKQFMETKTDSFIWCYNSWDGIDACVQYINQYG